MKMLNQITIDKVIYVLFCIAAAVIDFFMIRMIWRMAACDYEIMIHKDLVFATWYIGTVIVIITAAVMYLLYKAEQQYQTIEEQRRAYLRMANCFKRDCPEEYKMFEEYYK